MTDVPQHTLDELRAPPYWVGVKFDSKPSALFVCPYGHTNALGHKFDIDKLGYVTPVVECGWAGCGFSKHVRLNGWRRWIESLMNEA